MKALEKGMHVVVPAEFDGAGFRKPVGFGSG
jgi:hypothetical protein